jgi:hypothetical protein
MQSQKRPRDSYLAVDPKCDLHLQRIRHFGQHGHAALLLTPILVEEAEDAVSEDRRHQASFAVVGQVLHLAPELQKVLHR